MSTEPPAPTQLPVVPAVSNGLGTYASLAGFIAAVVAFIVAWADVGLTAETVTLGATAGGILAAWYTGRSQQAKAITDKVIEVYQEKSTPTEEG